MTADYQVLVSDRARTPRLKLSVRGGLVVVVPRGFDRARVPSVVASKREWIRRHEDRLAEQAKYFVAQPPASPPERIALRAIGEDWSVRYRASDAPGVTAVERHGRQLLVYGAVDDQSAVMDALARWLSRKTREHLVPWLRSLAEDRGIDTPNVAVRSQRKRWASRSAKGTVSLNLRLMFLPHDVVRYALLHELAHAREMNHSRRYWTLLETIEPDFRPLDAKLREGWRLVPDWLLPDR